MVIMTMNSAWSLMKDFFKQFVNHSFLAEVVDATNECAREVLAFSIGEQSLITRWRDINIPEFLIFLGILFHMGNSYLDNLFARHFMSRNRFLLILKFLTGIRQYLKGKRHKYGINVYILASPSGLTLQLHMYEGQGHTNKVVAKLLKHYLNTGRHVYMDNFYNSVGLADFLLRYKTHVTGTLRVKRKRNPSIVCTSKLRRGGSIFMYNRAGSCVCKWKDQRDVLMISTKQSRIESMMSYYTCEHKTMRWYKKVGIHIFQTMLLNAYFLFNMKMGKTMDYLEFRKVVITKLLALPPEGHRVDRQANRIHLPAHLPKDQKGNTKRRRCKYCWYTKKVRKNCLFYCPDCENEPGLCLKCLRTYHRYN
ncbi:hypothetical protein ABMA27_007800 [Loxostege sticticalis]|uniref:PiggyBac transposable element-derived protein domain-containing protein n=1 Tax=Loxostege sticticalis TaxID=481309 RepID=A0ABR3HCX8_LOXSC